MSRSKECSRGHSGTQNDKVSILTELLQSPWQREDRWLNCILALEVVASKRRVTYIHFSLGNASHMVTSNFKGIGKCNLKGTEEP